MLGILWHILTIRAIPFTARNCSHILRPRNANSSACLLVKYPMSCALNTGRNGHCWRCIVTPRRIEKYGKIPRNRNFSGIQNGCTFPTRKTKQISMAISIQAPKLQVPTTKIWFNMVQYLKETKNICFLGGYGTIMVYPPLETVWARHPFKLQVYPFQVPLGMVLLGSWCWQGIGLREIPQEMVGKCLRW